MLEQKAQSGERISRRIQPARLAGHAGEQGLAGREFAQA